MKGVEGGLEGGLKGLKDRISRFQRHEEGLKGLEGA